MSCRELTTERLVLRPATEADDLFLYELHRNPDLVRFIPSAVLADVAAARAMVPRLRSLLDDPLLGHWLVTLRGPAPGGGGVAGEAVAMVMAKRIPASAGVERDDVEIGWRQAERHCGHGYVTEAARAVLDHLHAGGLDRVVAVTHPDNVASQAVCRRLGMRHLGPSDDYYDTTTELFESVRPAGAGASSPERTA